MKNILIIDDYDLLLAALRLALEEEYFVFTAQSGEAGLGMMELIQPDMVITDMNMPGMSGLELIKRINIVGVDLCVDPVKKLQDNPNTNSQGGHRGMEGGHIGPPLRNKKNKTMQGIGWFPV
ncbi:response regulator [bacterium]|nr:response regulator [bacterium]